MHGREELKYKMLDKGGYHGETKAYIKEEADKVMDAMEKRIKDFEANHKLWEAENDALRNRVKEIESDLSTMEVSYEALIRNWVNVAKDTDLRLQYHIKELEATISILETTAPKWISVGDRLPNEKEQYELLWVGYVRTDNTIKYVYEASFDYETKQFYTENDWGDKTFIEPDIWMVVPPPPTTEESSPIEKEDK